MRDQPLVFVHGITGGVLRDPRGAVRWLGMRQVLGLDRRPLMLPLEWGEEQERDDLVPHGPIGRVFGVSVYGAFLDRMRRRFRHLHPLAYDWRRDLPESVERLRAKLTGLREEHGRPAQVVAHSMGGVVTWLTLREDPSLASSVLFAGVPFKPGISYGGNMHAGATHGLSGPVGGTLAQCSWTAPYFFFPAEDPQVPGVDHDWYDAVAWERNRFGPFAMDVDPGPWRGHLERALVRARRTRDLLDEEHPEPGALPPIAVLSGVGHGSCQEVLREGPKAVRGWDFWSGRSIEGDGAVARTNSLPPGGVQQFEATSKNAHQPILNDVEAVDSLLEALA